MAVHMYTADKERLYSALAKLSYRMESITDEEGHRHISVPEMFRFKAIIREIERMDKTLTPYSGWDEPVRPVPKGIKRGS